jgi:carboxyl-terminal processing protease
MPDRLHTFAAVMAGLITGAGLALMAGVFAQREVPPAAQPVVVAAGHRLLDEVTERVRRDYVDPVEGVQLEQAAVEGLVASLDPHSAFLDVAEYDEMRAKNAGSYTGVGIEIASLEGRVAVVTPIDGSPAALAGVKPGDVIVAVDGQTVGENDLESAIVRLRGVSGSHVRLAVARDGEPEPLTFDLQRSRVHVQTVRAAALPGAYGYVAITQFTEATPGDLERVLADLQSDVATPLRGLVLDLRANPGGVLESSVSVADQFLEAGLIVRAEGRAPDARFEMNATPGDALHGAPLIVLVDHGSASGAEIVAGALRDHGRAALMGETTYGKGSVQTVIPLRRGQALKLTTSRYYTPSGASIHQRGLEPDFPVTAGPEGVPARAGAGDPQSDPVIRTALQYLRDRSLGTKLARSDRS